MSSQSEPDLDLLCDGVDAVSLGKKRGGYVIPARCSVKKAVAKIKSLKFFRIRPSATWTEWANNINYLNITKDEALLDELSLEAGESIGCFIEGVAPKQEDLPRGESVQCKIKDRLNVLEAWKKLIIGMGQLTQIASFVGFTIQLTSSGYRVMYWFNNKFNLKFFTEPTMATLIRSGVLLTYRERKVDFKLVSHARKIAENAS